MENTSTISSTHMNKRPPRNVLTDEMQTPHQHAEQRPDDEITNWVTYEGGDINPLEVPEQVKRPGWVVQWKSKSVMGEPKREYQAKLWRTGWRPVPGIRGKGYFFVGNEDVPATIDMGASMLMERPEYIENEARKQAKAKADGQVADKLREIGMKVPENVRSKVIQHKTVSDNTGFMADLGVPEE